MTNLIFYENGIMNKYEYERAVISSYSDRTILNMNF